VVIFDHVTSCCSLYSYNQVNFTPVANDGSTGFNNILTTAWLVCKPNISTLTRCCTSFERVSPLQLLFDSMGKFSSLFFLSISLFQFIILHHIIWLSISGGMILWGLAHSSIWLLIALCRWICWWCLTHTSNLVRLNIVLLRWICWWLLTHATVLMRLSKFLSLVHRWLLNLRKLWTRNRFLIQGFVYQSKVSDTLEITICISTHWFPLQ